MLLSLKHNPISPLPGESLSEEESFNLLHVPTLIPKHEKHQFTIESPIEPTDKSHAPLGEEVKVYFKRHKSKTIPDATCQTFDLDSGNTTFISDANHVIRVVDNMNLPLA